MSSFGKARERIRLKPADPGLVARISDELSVAPAIASILVTRGLDTYESCRRFFNPDPAHLHDPFMMNGMEKAVVRIGTAIDKKEKITLYGDYDVDGISATVLMMRVLKELGAECSYYLPNRLIEGYGVSSDGIRAIAARGTALIITVDCGIAAVEETALARGLGIDMIVSDHHEPHERLPDAFAVLNPRIGNCGYPDDSLAGVGVALKLCQALCRHLKADERIWRECMDLAAIGTAADIVPMRGENRIITAAGFSQLASSHIPGLRALIDTQGLTGKTLSTHHVVFQLAPCINAVGRLGDPARGAELLLTEDRNLAACYAQELVAANLERRAINLKVENEAAAWVMENGDADRDYALVCAKRDWHVGVIGIVASRLVEKFYRPTILLSIDADGMARGSGRSIPGIHLLNALSECRDLLENFGGHAAAAGLTLKSALINAFRDRFNNVVARQLSHDDLVPTVLADADVQLGAMTPQMFRIINRMQPFGPGNMRPVLVCRDLEHHTAPRGVGNNHLKMTVSQTGSVMDAIGFNFGDRIDEIRNARRFSLAFCLDENEWNGKKSLQMKIKGVEV